jgi:hypothetical protein
MQFRPCLDKTALLLRKRPGNEFHGTNREDRSFVLSVSMEMRNVMRHAGLGEHADDDSEKPAEFWPSYFLAQKCVFKEKRAPRGSMELIRQTQKGPPGEPVGP